MAEQEFKAAKEKSAFRQFQWHLEGADMVSIPSGAAVRMASKVRDISTGISTILELVEHDLVLSNEKLLTTFQMGSLVRMGIAASADLDECAASFGEWVEQYHMAEVKHV
jgi:hypothetical protein